MWRIILLHIKPLYGIHPSNIVLCYVFNILRSKSTKVLYKFIHVLLLNTYKSHCKQFALSIENVFILQMVQFLFKWYSLMSLHYLYIQNLQFTFIFTTDCRQLLGSRVRQAGSFGRSRSRLSYHMVYNDVFWSVTWMKIYWNFFGEEFLRI